MSLLKKKGEKSSDGREYGAQQAQGPFTPEEMERLHGLVDDVGLQKDRGFIVVVKRKTIEKNEEHESAEIDGIVKVSQVNRKFMLDTLFHALGMDNKQIIEYVTMRTVVGSDFDEAEHDHSH